VLVTGINRKRNLDNKSPKSPEMHYPHWSWIANAVAFSIKYAEQVEMIRTRPHHILFSLMKRKAKVTKESMLT
jgi:hypothetical protein